MECLADGSSYGLDSLAKLSSNFAVGLALGDPVITGPSEDKKYVIQSVASKSGHLVYRVWFGEAKNKKQVREDVER